MKAITFNEFGDADVLKLADVPDPEVRPDDLLVRVYAAGVNRADLTHRRGGYGRPNFGDSTIMGLEIAGEVLEVGASVEGYHVGDRVMGVVGGGAYAELARIDWRMAMPIPEQLDYVHAAAIPEVFVTAHEAMMHLGRLTQGDSVLIHAAGRRRLRRRPASLRGRSDCICDCRGDEAGTCCSAGCRPCHRLPHAGLRSCRCSEDWWAGRRCRD